MAKKLPSDRVDPVPPKRVEGDESGFTFTSERILAAEHAEAKAGRRALTAIILVLVAGAALAAVAYSGYMRWQSGPPPIPAIATRPESAPPAPAASPLAVAPPSATPPAANNPAPPRGFTAQTLAPGGTSNLVNLPAPVDEPAAPAPIVNVPAPVQEPLAATAPTNPPPSSGPTATSPPTPIVNVPPPRNLAAPHPPQQRTATTEPRPAHRHAPAPRPPKAASVPVGGPPIDAADLPPPSPTPEGAQ